MTLETNTNVTICGQSNNHEFIGRSAWEFLL